MAGTHPGATWRLTDLQCHTPRDVGWVGEPRLPASTEAEDAARHDWARTFVAAAKERGLSLVAITDHHDVVMARYVREAALHDEELVVWPGSKSHAATASRCSHYLTLQPNLKFGDDCSTTCRAQLQPMRLRHE